MCVLAAAAYVGLGEYVTFFMLDYGNIYCFDEAAFAVKSETPNIELNLDVEIFHAAGGSGIRYLLP